VDFIASTNIWNCCLEKGLLWWRWSCYKTSYWSKWSNKS